jgi:hypothetical protein
MVFEQQKKSGVPALSFILTLSQNTETRTNIKTFIFFYLYRWLSVIILPSFCRQALRMLCSPNGKNKKRTKKSKKYIL